MTMHRRRTQARELALQFLYQLDLLPGFGVDDLTATAAWSQIPDEAKEFAFELARECWKRREEIDREIRGAVEHWDLERMAVVDRNILRLAIYELFFREDIPPKVSINEAIELGKRFSTKHSGAFINGILDRIVREHPEVRQKASSGGLEPERGREPS
jgi:transcription antitermination factor NusB